MRVKRQNGVDASTHISTHRTVSFVFVETFDNVKVTNREKNCRNN